MQQQRASYEEWLDKYEEAYLSPDVVPQQRCPNCGAQTLRLVFVVRDEGSADGRPAYWCDTCMYGLLLSRITVPHGGAKVPESYEVPNYNIVPPGTEASS
jgi:hypothetical protein